MVKTRPNRHIITDPQRRALYYKFLRARVQARYWCQAWTLTFEQYAALMHGVAWQGVNRRDMDALNLCRKDKSLGWDITNCHLLTRAESLRRLKVANAEGRTIPRRRANPELDKKYRYHRCDE